jgi:hypothetical protein
MYNDRYRQLTINESDRRISNDGKFRFPLPADVVSICFIADKIERPAVMWAQGLDFAVEFWGGSPWLAISHDPFLTDGLEISSTLGVDNEIADRSVALWMVAAARNIYPLAEQWGTVFDVSPTTEDQRAHLLQLFKTMALGPTSIRLMIGAGRAFGHPVCEKDEETVVSVITDRRGIAVITDQSVYRFPTAASILVAAGDSLLLGQPISSAVKWYDLATGAYPDVPALAVSKTDLGAAYIGGLIFPNEYRDVLVTSQADRTKIQVELDGTQADQQTFWDEVHTRGVAGGNTLANFLDNRPNPVGEPTASNLPATLNPYQLLLSQALSHHTILCVLDYSQTLANEGSQFLANWHKLMPSHQTIHAYSLLAGTTGSLIDLFSNPSTPGMGMVMPGAIGYYGIGTSGSAGGEPIIDQGAF